MAKTRDELLALLNCDSALVNLQKLLKEETLPPTGEDVNNHIHTTYSFSPYSPTAAVYFARMAGLATCGLMDHDSIAGAEEFPAVLVRDGQSRDITLYLKALSPEERTLLMEGCLINHYAAQRGQNHA